MEAMEGILKQQETIDCVERGVKTAADRDYFPHKVLISPGGCKPVREMGPGNGQYYMLDDLYFRDIIKTRPITFYYGLPEFCPVCGMEASRYVFYKSAYFSRSVSAFTSEGLACEELAEFRSDLCSERYFLLVPFCAEHENAEIFAKSLEERESSENVFYVKDPFFAGLLERHGFGLKKVFFVKGYSIPAAAAGSGAVKTVKGLLFAGLLLRLFLAALSAGVLLAVPPVWIALPSLLVMALFVSFNLIQWLVTSSVFDRLIRRNLAQYDDENC